MNSPRDALTERIIGCAIAVHRELGPGLLEAIYEEALSIELDEQGLVFRRQLAVPAVYKGRPLGEYRLDLLVEEPSSSRSRVSTSCIRYSKPNYSLTSRSRERRPAC